MDKLLLILKGAPIGNKNAEGPHTTALHVVKHPPRTRLGPTVVLGPNKSVTPETPNRITYGIVDEEGRHFKQPLNGKTILEEVLFDTKKVAQMQADYTNAKLGLTPKKADKDVKFNPDL